MARNSIHRHEEYKADKSFGLKIPLRAAKFSIHPGLRPTMHEVCRKINNYPKIYARGPNNARASAEK